MDATNGVTIDPDGRSTAIEWLADRPECLERLAAWFTRQWPVYYAPGSGHDAAAIFRERLRRDGVPCTFVAFEAGVPVGTVSLMTRSIASHAHLTPWVGGLYVEPVARSRGIGMSLVAHALDAAAALGVERVYAAVHARPDVYLARGWDLLEETVHDGETISVLGRVAQKD